MNSLNKMENYDRLAKAIKEQGRHISSLRCGLGTTDAIASLDELADMLAKLCEKQANEIAELKSLSVTSILLRVAVGNGDGEEIYAKSVAEVENELTKLGSELEDWQLGIKLHPVIAEKDRKLAQIQGGIVAAINELPIVAKKSAIHAELMRGIGVMLKAMLTSTAELESIKAAERQAGRDEVVALIIRPPQPTDERK
jgi:hypothetical protein